MIKIAVCDDEQYVLDELSELISELGGEIKDTLSADCFLSLEALFDNDELPYDIFLLDINMGEMSGMEAARAIRSRSKSATIIFITSMVQFALEGYEVHAFGFLPKPVDKDKYKAKLSDAIQWHKKTVGSVVTIKESRTTYRIPSAEILYIDVLNHKLRIITDSGEHITYTPLKQIADELPSGLFFRCHKSFIVNLAAISRISYTDVTMKNGVVIPISKHRKSEFLTAFSRFSEGMM